jgi:dUTPase
MSAVNYIEVETTELAATMPELHCPMASAFHIFSSEDVLLEPWEKRFIQTGLSIRIPHNFYGQIVGRQTMMAIGVDVACSVLEPRHQHKLKVFLANNTGHELPIMVGDKIAALLVMPCDQLVMRSYLQDEENPRPLDLSRI